MPDKVPVAALLSGNGTTMSALLFASRLPDCPYEIVLVASNQPDAPGLQIAEAEGIATFAHSHKGLVREEHEAIVDKALRDAGAEYLALCGYMRILTEGFHNEGPTWAPNGRVLMFFRDQPGANAGPRIYSIDLTGYSGAPSFCTIASNARYSGFGGIFGPGYPGHDDHVHVDIRSGQSWSAPSCGI